MAEHEEPRRRECSHNFTQRAGSLQAGDCITCLKAVLAAEKARADSAERERDDLAELLAQPGTPASKIMTLLAQRYGASSACDILHREKDEALARAEAAEATRERAIGLLHRCVFQLKDGRLAGDVQALLSPPAEPLRTGGAPKQEEPGEFARAQKVMAERDALRAEAADAHAECKALDSEVTSLRAQVERLEKALNEADEYISEHVALRPDDHVRMATLRSIRAALAPEAPVEKEKCPSCADHGWIGRPDDPRPCRRCMGPTPTKEDENG